MFSCNSNESKFLKFQTQHTLKWSSPMFTSVHKFYFGVYKSFKVHVIHAVVKEIYFEAYTIHF